MRFLAFHSLPATSSIIRIIPKTNEDEIRFLATATGLLEEDGDLFWCHAARSVSALILVQSNCVRLYKQTSTYYSGHALTR